MRLVASLFFCSFGLALLFLLSLFVVVVSLCCRVSFFLLLVVLVAFVCGDGLSAAFFGAACRSTAEVFVRSRWLP